MREVQINELEDEIMELENRLASGDYEDDDERKLLEAQLKHHQDSLFNLQNKYF